MGSLKKLYGWDPVSEAWVPIKVDSNGKVVLSNLTVTFTEVTTFLNSWVSYGAGYETAGYCKDGFGFVHLKGHIKSGVIGKACFTLPSGYYPPIILHISTASNNAYGQVTLMYNEVRPTVGSNTWFSLTGIQFFVG